ncbi:Protein BTG2 [Smittium mucronatum]|uniref:Protein BTG2 n=1 Tax=Smittium mucronatum TaxID=133383 RepID=A0A1R0H1C1_9FUNG|nr:Protein BTG2 [Smittium mucronatum]
MKQEISHLVEFIVSKIPDISISAKEREIFTDSLRSEITLKYTGHWHPETSQLGSGYRSISFWNGSLDPILLNAARAASLDPKILELYLPPDIVIWCDPYNVSYRIGDYGNLFTIFENKKGLIESAKRSMAERVSKTNGDFVISAYTTPVVMRRAGTLSHSGSKTSGSNPDLKRNVSPNTKLKSMNSSQQPPNINNQLSKFIQTSSANP